jgi:predicted PurR-regulated permease PerM
MIVINLIIVFVVVFKMLAKYEPMYKKIRRLDNDPTNSVKSNIWDKEHGKI